MAKTFASTRSLLVVIGRLTAQPIKFDTQWILALQLFAPCKYLVSKMFDRSNLTNSRLPHARQILGHVGRP